MATRRVRQGKTVQKTIHFEADVWEALEKHMSRERLDNASAATNDAVRYALFAEHREDRNGEVVKVIHQFQTSFAEHKKKTARDISILQEITLHFMKQYFLHTHVVSPKDRSAAEAQARIRLDKVMEDVLKGLSHVET